MKQNVMDTGQTGAASPLYQRILGAAFSAFTEDGYAATSTLDIATRAKVSKRDLYANFGSKQAILVACIKSRVDRLRPPPDLPAPRTRQMLAATLARFATTWLSEVSQPAVIATFRLAIAEATRSPEVAEALDMAGRAAVREMLARLLAGAQEGGLLGEGEAWQMAGEFLGLVWRDLMVGLLLGVAAAPTAAEAAQRAADATTAFLKLHPSPCAEK